MRAGNLWWLASESFKWQPVLSLIVVCGFLTTVVIFALRLKETVGVFWIGQKAKERGPLFQICECTAGGVPLALAWLSFLAMIMRIAISEGLAGGPRFPFSMLGSLDIAMYIPPIFVSFVSYLALVFSRGLSIAISSRECRNREKAEQADDGVRDK